MRVDIHLVSSIDILKTYDLRINSLVCFTSTANYYCGGGGGDNGDGLNRILGMKPSAVDRHEYKKYRCVLLLSGIKIIHGMNNRFDFSSGLFLSDRFGII